MILHIILQHRFASEPSNLNRSGNIRIAISVR